MTDDYCRHDLPLAQCADCKPLPDGVKRSGYVTKGGSVYHNDPLCSLMLDGQRRSARQGKETHEPERIRWVDAQARGLGTCRGCCTHQWIKRHSNDNLDPATRTAACFVWHNGAMRAAQLIRWITRDGRKWAEVAFLINGREVTVIKSERFVSPR